MLLTYVLPSLPEKFDSALGQLIHGALLSAEATRANTLKPELNVKLTDFAGEILKSEQRRVRARLGIRAGLKLGTKRRNADHVRRDEEQHLDKIKRAVLKLYARNERLEPYRRNAVANEIGISDKTLSNWLASGEWDFEDLVTRILKKRKR